MRRMIPKNSHVLCDRTQNARMKTFEKGLSKTVAPLYFADTYAYRHTWILRKPKFRLTDTHGFRIREALSKKL